MENEKGSSDGEDIPSDFFDDFTKEEFIEGLSVVDSWKDVDKNQQSQWLNAEDLNKVDDLRDLIDRDRKNDIIVKGKYRWRRFPAKPGASGASGASGSELEIKPGSRRDPDKTKQAIKKDKEEKVKEYLAKHLEASDDIRPPGTELDDFFEGKKPAAKKQPSESKSSITSPPREPRERISKIRRASPMRRRDVLRPFPQRRQHWSPRRPPGSPRRPSPRRFSPRRPSPRHFRREQRASPRRRMRSPPRRAFRRSRSPDSRDRELQRRSRSRSRNRKSDDDFLYPKDYYPPEFATVKQEIQYPPMPLYSEPMVVEYPGGVPPQAVGPPGFPYGQGAPSYGGYGAPYEYQGQPDAPVMMQAPQPVPAPVLPPTITSPVDMNPGMAPAIVPAPQLMTAPMITNQALAPRKPEPAKLPPDEALAKLVADGILSHEDYLKLAPNKGVSHVMDTPARVAVLNRVHVALSRLCSVAVPSRMIVNSNALASGAAEPAPPKFCSPLKRRAAPEFHFCRADADTVARRNKQVLELIVQTLHLEGAVGKPKRRPQRNTKDAETQTSKPFCDSCAVREAAGCADAATSVDRELACASVHTQVEEQELASSKALFAPMSIAHMTPAQLVSQLAARAKTLKQGEAQPHRADYHGGYRY